MTVLNVPSRPAEDEPAAAAASGNDGGGVRQISLLREPATLVAAEGTPTARRPRGEGWLDSWLETRSDLVRLRATNPMLDAVIDEIDGRRIRIGDQWLGLLGREDG